MRSRTISMIRSWRAWSSGVRFPGLFFFAIAVLQQQPDSVHVLFEVAEQRHDSRHVAMRDRRLHARMVPFGSRGRKSLFGTRLRLPTGPERVPCPPCTGYG